MAQAIVMGQSGGGGLIRKIPTFTGQSAVYGDDKKGYMQIFTTGNLIFNSDLLIDIFLVGGGGGGARDGTGSAPRGGGGGGYTGTWTGQPFTKNQNVAVYIGSGYVADGSSTSFANKYSVNGGLLAKSQTGYTGGNGGSGGGGGGTTGGNGGINGSNGNVNSSSTMGAAGVGQGTTTAAFRGDVAPFAGMYFSGGGGGGGDGGKGGTGYYGAGDGGSGIQGESHDGKRWKSKHWWRWWR
ncbi:MAG: hypothetical protein RR806_06380 [Oscillospiraceae bacterium]